MKFALYPTKHRKHREETQRIVGLMEQSLSSVSSLLREVQAGGGTPDDPRPPLSCSIELTVLMSVRAAFITVTAPTFPG